MLQQVSYEDCVGMNTIILFMEYLFAPIRVVRIWIIQFRRSLIKRRETRLQKRLERIGNTPPIPSEEE